MAAREEVLIEVEAVQAVYGDDCVVLDSFPPHLHVHIKPRTADISSEQFVEALIAIRASSKYPEETPGIDLVDSKGLDQERKKHLIASLHQKACELSSCLMLVALCEEAVEKLSVMNHPDGDCPLCLYPLVLEEDKKENLPFMKLMSCFHCFHSECIIRWWNWIQKEKESNSNATSSVQSIRDREKQNVMNGAMGSCPVCRKVFHTKDFEHVLGLVGLHSTHTNSENSEMDREGVLESDYEKSRREKFEHVLKIQQEHSGLIEPKKDLLVLPGMYLAQPAQTFNKEEQQRDSVVSSSKAGSSQRRNSGRRKQRPQHWKKPAVQWIRKEDSASQ